MFKPIVVSFKDFWIDTYVSVKGIVQNNRLLLLACSAVIVLLVALSRPFPTDKVYLSVGQPGSSFDVLGTYLQEYFKKYRVDLVKIETSGLEEGLEKLDDNHSQINAAFLTAGRPIPDHYDGLVSLGSIQFSPAWLFYRGARLTDKDFLEKRIAIGAEGTNTLSIFMAAAKARGLDVEKNPQLLKLKHSEAVALLNSGMIDALFIVDGFDSPNVQALLADQKNQIFNFSLADAYEKQLPFLKKLTIPKGSLDLAAVRPATDTDVLSTTVTLLVEDDLNPFVQWLFIKAIKDMNNGRAHFFAPPNFFPAYLDRSVPLSDVASRYYQSGFPSLTESLPLWLAVYLDRVWVYLLGFLAIALPLAQLIPNIRNYYVDSLVDGINNELGTIESMSRNVMTPEERYALLEKLNTLEDRIKQSPLANLDLAVYIKAFEHAQFVRKEIEK